MPEDKRSGELLDGLRIISIAGKVAPTSYNNPTSWQDTTLILPDLVVVVVTVFHAELNERDALEAWDALLGWESVHSAVEVRGALIASSSEERPERILFRVLLLATLDISESTVGLVRLVLANIGIGLDQSLEVLGPGRLRKLRLIEE